MTVLMVSYKVSEDSMAEVESGLDAAITALRQEQPEGVRYALCRLPDGVTILGLLELADGVDNPLPGIPAARRFQQDLAGWVDGDPPTTQPIEVLASYRFFD